MTETLDVLYDGWNEYRRSIKGYSYTPAKIDIEDWETFKQIIFSTIEERNGTRTADKRQQKITEGKEND